MGSFFTVMRPWGNEDDGVVDVASGGGEAGMDDGGEVVCLHGVRVDTIAVSPNRCLDLSEHCYTTREKEGRTRPALLLCSFKCFQRKVCPTTVFAMPDHRYL